MYLPERIGLKTRRIDPICQIHPLFGGKFGITIDRLVETCYLRILEVQMRLSPSPAVIPFLLLIFGLNLSLSYAEPDSPVAYRLEAENYSGSSGPQRGTACGQSGNEAVGHIADKDWLKFPQVDFGKGLLSLKAICSKGPYSAQGTSSAALRMDSKTGKIIATWELTNTGGWHIYQSIPVKILAQFPKGKHDLYLTFSGGPSGGLMNIDYLELSVKGTISLPGKTEMIIDQDPDDYSYSLEEVSFSNIVPDHITIKQCWNGMGIHTNGDVYIGWTSDRSDGKEDFVVFKYSPVSGSTFVGTLLETSLLADNLETSEEMPKGHSKIVSGMGGLYLTSMGFHDIKSRRHLTSLSNFRGAHLYRIDPNGNNLADLSARSHPQGVATHRDGIIALTMIPGEMTLVGLSHPKSDLYLFNLPDGKLIRHVSGIPFPQQNKTYGTVSREIVADRSGQVYFARGTESIQDKDARFSMWTYNTKQDRLEETTFSNSGGYWSGQASTSDGKWIYISTVNGQLYRIDTGSKSLEYVTHLIPKTEKAGSVYLWGITIVDDRKILFAPATPDQGIGGSLYEYDIVTGNLRRVLAMDKAIYYSANCYDIKREKLYFARFGKECPTSWEENCRLVVVKVKKKGEK